MRVRKLSIVFKLILIVAVLLIITDFTLGFVVYKMERNSLMEQITTSSLAMADCISASLEENGTSDYFGTLDVGDEGTEEYAQILKILRVFYNNSNSEYIYTTRLKGSEQMEFVVDSDPEKPGMIGDQYDYNAAVAKAYEGISTVGTEYSDEWGNHISVYSPIYNSKGEVTALTTIDISVNWIYEQLATIRNTIVLICALAFVVGMLVVIIIMQKLKQRFKTLNDKVVELGNGNGDLTKIIDIQSGDEMEEIAKNVNKFIIFIREIITETIKNADALTEASNTMRNMVYDTTGKINDVSSAMEEMSASSEEVSASLSVISESIEEVFIKVQDIASKAKDNTTESEQIIKATEKIYDYAMQSKEEISIKSEK